MNITLDDGRTELWQWDTGRKIVVDDKSVSEVHYSKYSSTQAITREVINGKAEIPNFLLQDTHAVTVYAYSGSIENGYTVAEKTFNVAKKPKPANYVETEEDKAILAKLKAEIGDLTALQTNAKDNLVEAINEAAAKEIVLFTIDYNRSDDTYVSDRTYEELATALNSGKLVVAKFGNVGMGELYSYGLLCQAGMYVEGLFVYVTSDQPYRWYCTKGNVWTKRRLLNLEMEIEMPFYEEDVGNVLTQVKSSGEYYKYKYAPKSIAGYGVKYIAEGYIGENNEFICTTSSEEVIRRCSEIDDGCLCAISIMDGDSYTIAIAEGGLCGDKGMIFSRVCADYRGNLHMHWCSLNIESDTVSWSTYKHENITDNYYVELDGVYPNYTLSSATPIQDIKTAYVNGKTLFCRCIIGGYTAVLPLFVPGPTDNLWLFSGSGGINRGRLGFYSQYFTIAVTSNGVMAEHELIATKEYVDNKEVVVKSSTAGSTKKFKITVDDTGALSAVEVT